MKKTVRKKPYRSSAQLFVKRYCKFCKEKIDNIDYKNTAILSKYITEQGKILPSRITGNCAYHQRQVTKAIKQSRCIALMPFKRD